MLTYSIFNMSGMQFSAFAFYICHNIGTFNYAIFAKLILINFATIFLRDIIYKKKKKIVI